jgi:hypothetical protein
MSDETLRLLAKLYDAYGFLQSPPSLIQTLDCIASTPKIDDLRC